MPALPVLSASDAANLKQGRHPRANKSRAGLLKATVDGLA